MLLILILMLCLPNLSQCAPFCCIAGMFPGEEERKKKTTNPTTKGEPGQREEEN